MTDATVRAAVLEGRTPEELALDVAREQFLAMAELCPMPLRLAVDMRESTRNALADEVQEWSKKLCRAAMVYSALVRENCGGCKFAKVNGGSCREHGK